MSVRILLIGVGCVVYAVLLVYLARHPRCPEGIDPATWNARWRAWRRKRRAPRWGGHS